MPMRAGSAYPTEKFNQLSELVHAPEPMKLVPIAPSTALEQGLPAVEEHALLRSRLKPSELKVEYAYTSSRSKHILSAADSQKFQYGPFATSLLSVSV
jgi:hypothetical protein